MPLAQTARANESVCVEFGSIVPCGSHDLCIPSSRPDRSALKMSQDQALTQGSQSVLNDSPISRVLV
jgi:hypothetical protein